MKSGKGKKRERKKEEEKAGEGELRRSDALSGRDAGMDADLSDGLPAGILSGEKMALSAKAKDGKTVATALLSPPEGEGEGMLWKILDEAAGRFVSYLEKVLFPEEIRRYEEIPGSEKRKHYAPLHLYLSLTLSRASEEIGLSSCLGELMLYRGERIAEYRVFSLTADEKAEIFLSNKTLFSLLPGKGRRAAKESLPGDVYILEAGSLIACRPRTALLPIRCRRRDVREKLLEELPLGEIRPYCSPSPDSPLKRRRKAKKKEAKKSKRKGNPLDKQEEL